MIQKLNRLAQITIASYVFFGHRPGSFTTHCLANKFLEAAGAADSHNRLLLWQFADTIYNSTPQICRGDYERVEFWIKDGGMYGQLTKQNTSFDDIVDLFKECLERWHYPPEICRYVLQVAEQRYESIKAEQRAD
jgi:hypothetical protein